MKENKNVRDPILKWLNSLPRSYFEISPPGSKTGKPDITGCLNGEYVAIETKLPGKKPRQSQLYVHNRLHEAGARVFVASSLDEAKLKLGYWFSLKLKD